MRNDLFCPRVWGLQVESRPSVYYHTAIAQGLKGLVWISCFFMPNMDRNPMWLFLYTVLFLKVEWIKNVDSRKITKNGLHGLLLIGSGLHSLVVKLILTVFGKAGAKSISSGRNSTSCNRSVKWSFITPRGSQKAESEAAFSPHWIEIRQGVK